MTVYLISVLFSSISFLAYTCAYLVAPEMRSEFEELKIEKMSNLVVTLEFLGALGLIVGLFYTPIAILSSLGLSVLMFLGVVIRVKNKNSLKLTLQAIFFMFLNGYIFWETIY
jgi:hypothetical protein